MKKWIILGVLLALTIGVVVASDVDSQIKTPEHYGPIKNSCATYDTYQDRVIFVEKAAGVMDAYLKNDSYYKVYPVGDNIYYYEDTGLNQYGYQELVEIDGTQYFISVFQNSKLSPSEKTLLLNHLKELNKLNNFTPIAPPS